MKVLVEFDLSNSAELDLFNHVRGMLRTTEPLVTENAKLDTTPNNPACDVSKEELQQLYSKAAEQDSEAASDILASLQLQNGKSLSDWTTEDRYMASHSFKKLIDNTADRFK